MAVGEQATPGFNYRIPEQVMTPDRVETTLGSLEFFDGMPSAATVDAVYDNLDRSRGVESFLSGIPAASLEAIRVGLVEQGVSECHQILLMDELLDSAPLFLTGNTDTVYAIGALDLLRDGPTVVEVPPQCGPGTVDDAYFRFVIDMGLPGPDRGAGGHYLILPPDGEDDLGIAPGATEAVVDGQSYFVARSTSYSNLLILRGLLVDGRPEAPTAMFRDGLRVYPLAQKADPPVMEFVSGAGRPYNTIHANTFEFYRELHAVIDREPVSMLDPELRGLFASIGIAKGRPFEPDERMTTILTDAVAIGNATAHAIMYRPRGEGIRYYPGSAWMTTFPDNSYEFLADEGRGGRSLDTRTMFFYLATVNTPAMVWHLPGKGSQYGLATADGNGDYLDGSRTYKLTLPADVPAANFWSVVAYDPQTRSELQTGQPYPSKNNARDPLDQNADGTTDLFFGPEPPAGHESNWIQTVPGKGWFTLLRLYGPLEPWFDKTWRPGEIEPT